MTSLGSNPPRKKRKGEKRESEEMRNDIKRREPSTNEPPSANRYKLCRAHLYAVLQLKHT